MVKEIGINYFPFLSKLNVDLEDEELRERIDKKVTFKKWTNWSCVKI